MTKIQLEKQEIQQKTGLSGNHTGNQREGCELIDALLSSYQRQTQRTGNQSYILVV